MKGTPILLTGKGIFIFIVTVAAVMTLLGACPAAGAAEAASLSPRRTTAPPAGALRIHSVKITGVRGAQLADVQRVIRVRAGDLYSKEVLGQDYLAIAKLPFVLSARAVETRTPEGVDVVYEVKARGIVTGVRFIGNRKIKDKKLRAISNLKDLGYYDLGRLVAAQEIITDEYKRRGYLFAKVSFSSQSDGSILFTIKEGRRYKVKAVNILGNTHFSDALLKKQVRTKTRRYLFFSYRLDKDTVQDDVVRIRRFYHNHGYLDASVKVTLSVDRKRTGITVDYRVSEGPLYKVRSIEISGNKAISTDRLAAMLKMTKGTAFSPAGLTREVAAIEEAYGMLGYIDARVTPVTLFALKSPEVDVSYRIIEGRVSYINEVEILGNDKTRDNVIRRELEFAPGEKFNIKKIDDSKRNLTRLGHFSKVEMPPFEKTDDPTKRNVVIKVEEASTGHLSLSAGVSSNSGLMAQILFSQRNFDYARPPKSWRDFAEDRAWCGGGQSFELNLQPGTDYSRYSMSYHDPRVSDSRYSLDLGALKSQRVRDTYDEDRKNGRIAVGRSFGKDAFWKVSAQVGTVEISNIDIVADRNHNGHSDAGDIPDYLSKVRGSNKVNLLGFTVGRDTRDSFIRPTQGYRVSASVEGSSEAFGSDFDFARFVLAGRQYKKLATDDLDRPFVLSWRGRVGLLLPKSGSDDSPIFEHFFAGGATDVRGFDYRGLGPHDYNEPLGGEFLATGGLQYEFPLQGEILRGVLFYDAGTVLDNPGDFTLGDIRQSVGFGIRFQVPAPLNVPISLDFGFPIVKDSDDETQVFSFGMGWTM